MGQQTHRHIYNNIVLVIFAQVWFLSDRGIHLTYRYLIGCLSQRTVTLHGSDFATEKDYRKPFLEFGNRKISNFAVS